VVGHVVRNLRRKRKQGGLELVGAGVPEHFTLGIWALEEGLMWRVF